MLLETKHRTYREFAALFCEVLEDPTSTLLTIQSELITLYQASLNMPEILGDTVRDVPERISLDDYRRVKERIGAITQSDYFWICWKPFQSPPEKPICASLSDGLADIWRDLKPGLLALEEDEDKWSAAVFWDWKFSFDTHWGDHAVDSIWAIHKLLRDGPPPDTV